MATEEGSVRNGVIPEHIEDLASSVHKLKRGINIVDQGPGVLKDATLECPCSK
jgi:hypothetical protein